MKFKITKSYRGGSDVYYINRKTKPSPELLETIGQDTDGGHNYGWNIECKKVYYIPKNANILSLKNVTTLMWK